MLEVIEKIKDAELQWLINELEERATGNNYAD